MSIKILSARSFVIFLSALFFLLLIAGFFVFFSSCQQQSSPPVAKKEPPAAAEPPKQQPGGHFHADGTWHEGPHAPQPQVKNTPETPPEDLTPIPWAEAKQRLLERKAAAAEKTPVPPAATWEGRKQQVALDPDLIWQPFQHKSGLPAFIVPPIVSIDDVGPSKYYPLGNLYDYDVTYEVDIPKNTESQDKRIEAVLWEAEEPTSEDELLRLRRKVVAIEVEGLDTLTAAKYIKSGLGEPNKIAVEYAERAVHENPSAEAYHVLAWTQYDVNKEAAETALRRSVSMDPNYTRALRDLSILIYRSHPAEAIGYIQRAAALDRRIPENNYLLGHSYERLGHYEKALQVYQAMPFISSGFGSWGAAENIMAIQAGVPRIKPLGTD